LTTIRITETTQAVSVSDSSAVVSITTQKPTIDIRGGLVGPSVLNLETATAGAARGADDILAWNATELQFEPARVSIVAGALVFTYLRDLIHQDGALHFNFSEASGLLIAMGVI